MHGDAIWRPLFLCPARIRPPPDDVEMSSLVERAAAGACGVAAVQPPQRPGRPSAHRGRHRGRSPRVRSGPGLAPLNRARPAAPAGHPPRHHGIARARDRVVWRGIGGPGNPRHAIQLRSRTSVGCDAASNSLFTIRRDECAREPRPMLEYLHLKNVGPAPEMQLNLSPRVNVITGDNGLGKSFLLDVAWWAHRVRGPRQEGRRPARGLEISP